MSEEDKKTKMKQQKEGLLILIAIAVVGISLITTNTNANALEQQGQQGQGHKFIITMKLKNPHPAVAKSIFTAIAPGTIEYDVYNITSNLSDKNIQFPILGSGKNIEYNLNGSTVSITNFSIFWGVPYKIIDNTSTPDVIKTSNAALRTGSTITPMKGFEIAHNTKTNVTTYSQVSSLETREFQSIFDVNTTITTYPNNRTATLESREFLDPLSVLH